MTTATELGVQNWIAGTWKIDPLHSHVGFIIRHMVVSKVRGNFTEFDATIVTAENPLESTVEATITAASINTGNEMRDGHVASADFFDAENHPQFTFKSTGIRVENDEWLVDGDLTIRGVTKPVTLGMETPAFGVPGEDGAVKAGFSASTEINRNDFGVSYNGPIPGGGTVLGDKVEIVLEIEADLQK